LSAVRDEPVEHLIDSRRTTCAGWAGASRPLAALAGLLILAGCGSSATKSTRSSAPARASSAATTTTPPGAKSAAGTVRRSRGGITAAMRAGTHEPRVGRPWPIHFSVTRGARPISASVSYEYLFGGQVVARRSHYSFVGRFSDVFRWPSSAVGYPLTFRAVIAAGRMTIDLDYPVQVRR
jgi:hypothetical protein